MSKRLVDLKEYQKDKQFYIVIKDFYKIGSAVKGFNNDTSQEFRILLAKCRYIAKSPIQVVHIGGPEALFGYGEYGPYTVYENDNDLLQICVTGKCPGIVNPLFEESPYYSTNEERLKYRDIFLASECEESYYAD